MIKKIALTIFVCLITSSVFSQTWIYFGSSIDDLNKHYIRSACVSNDGTIKVWEKIISKKLTYINNQKSKTIINGYKILLKEYDYYGRKMKIHSVLTYDINGKLVDSFTLENYSNSWQDVVPESIGEMMMNRAFELFKIK